MGCRRNIRGCAFSSPGPRARAGCRRQFVGEQFGPVGHGGRQLRQRRPQHEPHRRRPGPSAETKAKSKPKAVTKAAAPASAAEAMGNESRHSTVSPAAPPPRTGMYGGDLDHPIASRIADLFHRSSDDKNDSNYANAASRNTANSNYVNGGLIGQIKTQSPGAGKQTMKKDALSNPTMNSLGGGARSYGKK